jgi:hypothetical protein
VIEFQKTHFDHEVRHAYGEVLSGLEMLRTVASDGSVKVISNTPHVPIKAMPQKWLKRGVLVMGNIPLDLQRRFEQRWAARFYRRIRRPRLKSKSLKDRTNSWPRLARAKEKPTRLSRWAA